VVPGRLDLRVRDRIIAETHGNPLALLELPHGLSPDQLAGGFGLPDPEGLSSRIGGIVPPKSLGPQVRSSLVSSYGSASASTVARVRPAWPMMWVLAGKSSPS
jgi:hypothetical protein